MTKKNLFIVISAVILSISLAACSEEQTSVSDRTAQADITVDAETEEAADDGIVLSSEDAVNTNPDKSGVEWFDRISDDEYAELAKLQ